MGLHHQVCVDENTQITHRLNWVDHGPVDEQWRPEQLVLVIGADSTGATGNVAPVLTQEPGKTLRAPVPFMAVL